MHIDGMRGVVEIAIQHEAVYYVSFKEVAISTLNEM